MELGMGVLGWPPAMFWESTAHELMPALDGYIERKGGKKKGLDDASRKRLQAMLADEPKSSPSIRSKKQRKEARLNPKRPRKR